MAERRRRKRDEPPADRVRARAFWSGMITFGLVSIPVELLAASRPARLSLHMLSESGTPLRRTYFCPEDDRELESDEIARGFPLPSGELVRVDDEELEAIAPEKTRDIDLRQFVDRGSISPLYFERAYFMAPSGTSSRAYHLLAETMERTGRAGIATFVMRGKEHLVAILAEGGVLRAEILRFDDEVRTPEQIGLPTMGEVDRKLVDAMRQVVRALSADALDPGELADEPTERLKALVERKAAAGEDVVRSAPSVEVEGEEGAVIDLMELLKSRMGLAREPEVEPIAGPRKARPLAKAHPTAKEAHAGRTKKELLERARRLGIEGRSKMSKDELERAIRRAS